MSTEHTSGKGYTALRQSISNTDTEDEDDNTARPLDNILKGAERSADTNAVCDKGCFYPLDETRNIANRGKNCRKVLGYCNDDIPIMVIDGDSHMDLWKQRREMSFLRRLCLAISILLCVATVLIFLYALPCDNPATCLLISKQQSPLTWDKTLEGVELHGPISVIPGSPDSLIFLLRGQRYGMDSFGSVRQQQIPSDGGGVLSMQGNSGTPLWWVTLKRLPLEIDCFALDTDGSGKADCIVAGEQGLLASIEPTAGMIHWSSGIHTYPKLPLLLPDIDSDGIDDLLSVEIMTESIGLVLLSGKNGQVLGRRSTPGCSSVQINRLNSNLTVSYLCEDANGKRSIKSLPLTELSDTVNSLEIRKILTSKLQRSSRAFAVQNNHAETYDWELTPFHRLSIENRETRPDEFYQANINLTLHKLTNESLLIWSNVNPNSFAMEPAILATTGYPYTTGFAVKFWQWSKNAQPERINSSLVKRKLTERVQVVLMNCTEVRTTNASQIEIIQLCQGNDCQPSLRLQTRSVAIADLNRDGTRELITYRSSYDLEKSQVLTSKIEIVKLNMEVSKLTQQNVDQLLANRI